MNFIAKKIHWIGILLLVAFSATAAALYLDVPAKSQKAKTIAVATEPYTCPMHPEVVSAKPGDCSKCGMDLVLASKVSKTDAHEGCGAETDSAAHGCCGKKETAAELTLPAGHPPVAGYTVESSCDHSAKPAAEPKK